MAKKKNDKEKEVFTLRVKVTDEGKKGEQGKLSVSISCEKDGEEGDFSLLGGDNLGMAYHAMTHAASLIANLYVRQLHANGKISNERFNELLGKSDNDKENENGKAESESEN